MSMKVETVILGPDTEQYAGRGQAVTNIRHIASVAGRMEALGFDGVTTPEAGHDPYLPLPLVAEHTEEIRIGTNVAIAFPRSPMVTAQIAWDLQQLSEPPALAVGIVVFDIHGDDCANPSKAVNHDADDCAIA